MFPYLDDHEDDGVDEMEGDDGPVLGADVRDDLLPVPQNLFFQLQSTYIERCKHCKTPVALKLKLIKNEGRDREG